ncbi:MAG: hypothetical protein BA871_02970 [Desulfuromonadales bacterium C00003096]|nr:MAG: hypothetical protein BA871_02970 [Desulfuromonadales bacterium C00003096]
MKKWLLLIMMFLGLNSWALAAPIDLTGWTPYPGGTWNVSADGSSVLQTTNGQPTYFVSTANYIDTQFKGSFGVETTSDDDFIGFVFGFNGFDDYLLFDWKQGRQSYTGFASDGYTLSKITGSGVNLWDHTGSDIQVLDTSYGAVVNDVGWADNTVYDFTLDYTNSGIKISIDNDLIFDIAGTFDTGKFGFYNYSQSQVRYQGFTEDPAPPSGPAPVPEPGTLLLVGAGIIGLVGYNRKRLIKG